VEGVEDLTDPLEPSYVAKRKRGDHQAMKDMRSGLMASTITKEALCVRLIRHARDWPSSPQVPRILDLLRKLVEAKAVPDAVTDDLERKTRYERGAVVPPQRDWLLLSTRFDLY
jgi:hypothetical protein